MIKDKDFYNEWSNVYLGYQFNNPDILINALTHPSFMMKGKKIDHYERLEFLGDSVLNLVITESLLKKFPKEDEGDLAKRRSALVCSTALVEIAEALNLNEVMIVSKSEGYLNGRNRSSNLENVLEAVVGAIYIDSGLELVREFVLSKWEQIFIRMVEPPKDPKTKLQEWLQKQGKDVPVYEIILKSGPAHLPTFTIKLTIDGYDEILVEASSRKLGEKIAAEKMLEIISEGSKK